MSDPLERPQRKTNLTAEGAEDPVRGCTSNGAGSREKHFLLKAKDYLTTKTQRKSQSPSYFPFANMRRTRRKTSPDESQDEPTKGPIFYFLFSIFRYGAEITEKGRFQPPKKRPETSNFSQGQGNQEIVRRRTRLYAAQAISKIDAEIAEKGRFAPY
jgi:hypothetical protein